MIDELFQRNRIWADKIKARDPAFFEKLSAQQNPKYLWIGCSDSRVPANEIVGLLPGEIFVHRNVANMVVHTDMNCLSVLQYAIEVLNVEHVIVCGHHGCGGVRAAMDGRELGLIDNWLRNIKDTYQHSWQRFAEIESREDQINLLCEQNVVEQVANVCHTTIVQNAWRRGQSLAIHGWVYGLKDGLLKDLKVSVHSLEQIPSIYQMQMMV